jgi:hypothetical protein
MRLSSGSMGPKAEAAARFVRETGGTAVIGALTDARAMLAGDAGTRVLPDVEPERAAESSRSPTPFSAGPAVGTTQPIRGAARMQTRPPMKIIARHTNQAKEMSPMFKKIIWATDGSNAADLALPHAKTLAKDADGELLIVHSEEWIASGPRSGHYPVHADEDEIKAKIKGQAAEIGADGVRATLKVVETGASGAAHAIADVARDEHAERDRGGHSGPYRPRRTVARQRDAAAAAHRPMSSACRARRRPRNQRLNLRARGDAGPLQRLSPPSSPTPHLTTA